MLGGREKQDNPKGGDGEGKGVRLQRRHMPEDAMRPAPSAAGGAAGEEGSMGTGPDPETRPTCNHHGSFRLYVLLFPRALIELLLPQRHLVGFYVPPLRVLGGKVESLA